MAKAVADILRLIAELLPPPVTSTVGMLGGQSVIGQRLKAGARRSRAVARAFAAALLACLARPTRVGSSGWLCSTTFLASAALIETWPSSSTLVGLPSELSSSAVRIPRSGASREEFQRSMPPRQRCLTSGNYLLAFAAVDRRLEISVIEDDEGRAGGRSDAWALSGGGREAGR